MKQFTWEQYYDSFWDWSENTQAQYLYGLMTLGPIEEVTEVLMELQYSDSGKDAANKLLAKAVEAGYEFTAEDLAEFAWHLDTEILKAAIVNSLQNMTEDDLNELYEDGRFEDDFIATLFVKRGYDVPDDLYDVYGQPYEYRGAAIAGSVFNTTFNELYKVVNCTQCGANVELDLSKGSAICKYCGASFIISPRKEIIPVSESEKKQKQYTWDEYYEKFWGWPDVLLAKNVDGLTSLGKESEVAFILRELTFDANAGNKLLAKAVAAKYVFDGDDLVEFAGAYDTELVTEAVDNSAHRLTEEDMENLYGLIDDEDIIRFCNFWNITLPEELREEEW